MRDTNFKVIDAVITNANITGDPIDSNQWVSASFQAYFSNNTPAGTFKIQASNDICPFGNVYADFTPTNWVDVPSATATITSGGAALILIPVCSFRSLRVVFTTSNGSATGNMTVLVDAKSV